MQGSTSLHLASHKYRVLIEGEAGKKPQNIKEKRTIKMSLLSSMSSGRKRNVTINVEDVRPNERNCYTFEPEMISSLSLSIKKYGQLENATVYEDDTLNDGRKYTLIGGESRYRAIINLVELGEHDGSFNVTIVDKPGDNIDEIEMLLHDNLQRHKDMETIKIEIEMYEEIYQKLVNNGRRPTGEKREWIGSKIGVSGRQIDRIKGGNINSSTAQRDVRELTVKDVEKALKRNKKALEKTIRIMEEVGIDSSLLRTFIIDLDNINL